MVKGVLKCIYFINLLWNMYHMHVIQYFLIKSLVTRPLSLVLTTFHDTNYRHVSCNILLHFKPTSLAFLGDWCKLPYCHSSVKSHLYINACIHYSHRPIWAFKVLLFTWKTKLLLCSVNNYKNRWNLLRH